MIPVTWEASDIGSPGIRYMMQMLKGLGVLIVMPSSLENAALSLHCDTGQILKNLISQKVSICQSTSRCPVPMFTWSLVTLFEHLSKGLNCQTKL